MSHHHHRSSELTECQKNNCQCPCHAARWYDGAWFGFLCVCGIVGTMILVATLVNWISSDTTLVATLHSEWQATVALMHRIW
jgi:hypothetical protein